MLNNKLNAAYRGGMDPHRWDSSEELIGFIGSLIYAYDGKTLYIRIHDPLGRRRPGAGRKANGRFQ